MDETTGKKYHAPYCDACGISWDEHEIDWSYSEFDWFQCKMTCAVCGVQELDLHCGYLGVKGTTCVHCGATDADIQVYEWNADAVDCMQLPAALKTVGAKAFANVACSFFVLPNTVPAIATDAFPADSTLIVSSSRVGQLAEAAGYAWVNRNDTAEGNYSTDW